MRDPQTLRMIDTGLRRAAENMAFNRSLLESHQAGESPHTLRFLRFEPCALVGFHQNIHQELHLQYCQEHNIAIQRRITGGGALYFDHTQIGWELYLDRRFLGTADMNEIARRICEAAASGIRELGVDAQFRPRNDIEVDGRKISGTGGAFDGDSILYQGTLLIDFDVERMLRILRIPAEKLSDKAIESARERVANLRELLGTTPDFEQVKTCLSRAFASAFGVALQPSEQLLDSEQARFHQALEDIDTEEWIDPHTDAVAHRAPHQAVHRCKGGLMRAAINLDRSHSRVSDIWITGDFFIRPARRILDLESYLRHTPIQRISDRIMEFFTQHDADMMLLAPEDFVTVVTKALNDPPAASA